MSFTYERDQTPPRVLDKDRGVALYYKGGTGGSAEDLQVYELHWDNQIIPFVVEPKIFNKNEIEYEIRQITIPDSLKGQQDIIIQLISEAFDVFGYAGRRDFISKLSVTLSPQVHI